MIDAVLLGLLVLSALLGLFSGVVGVVASTFSWLLGGWAAFHWGGDVAAALADGKAPGAGELVAGYVLCFVVVMLTTVVVGWIVKYAIRSMGLGGVDRGLGGVLGLARGALIGCLLLVVAGFTPLTRTAAWRSSFMVPVLLPGAHLVSNWLPEFPAGKIDLGFGRLTGDNGLVSGLGDTLSHGIDQATGNGNGNGNGNGKGDRNGNGDGTGLPLPLIEEATRRLGGRSTAPSSAAPARDPADANNAPSSERSNHPANARPNDPSNDPSNGDPARL